MNWLRVSRLAETSGLGVHQMLRRLKAMNAKVGGRLLRRAHPTGFWQVNESVLVEIREAEAARREEGEDGLGLSSLADRLAELEGTVESLSRGQRRIRGDIRALKDWVVPDGSA